MTAPSKVFPTSCLHAPLQIHYHCLPTALYVNKTWSHEIQNFFYFSQGYISWKGNEGLSLGTPHVHGPLQRTKKGPWQWFHVVIFVFFLKFAEVKCFSYKWKSPRSFSSLISSPLCVTLSLMALECPGGIFGIWLKEVYFGFHGIIYLVQSHFQVYRSYCWLNQDRNGFPGILLVPSVPTYLVSKHKRAGPEALTQHVQVLWLLTSEPWVIEHKVWNVPCQKLLCGNSL